MNGFLIFSAGAFFRFASCYAVHFGQDRINKPQRSIGINSAVKLKCQRLFRPEISKVKTSFFAQIRQESNILTPSADVSGYTPLR